MGSVRQVAGGRAALGVLLLASTLGVMGGAIIVPILEVARRELDVSSTAAGFIITTHGATIALASPLIGRAIDRFGVRPPMLAGLVLYALGGGAGLVADSYPLLIASRMLFGVGAAAVFATTTVALLALYRGPLRDRVMGWRTTATSIGGVVWPLLGGALGGLSWHAPFALYLVGIPIALAALALIPPAAGEGASDDDGGGVVQHLRRRPALLGWYALLLMWALMMYVGAVFLPKRLDDIGIDAPLLVAIYAVVGASLVGSIVGLAYGRIRARLSNHGILRVAIAAWAVAFLLYGTVSQPLVLIAAPILLGLGSGIAFPAISVLIDDATPAALRGRAQSLSATALFTGQFSSPLVFGPLVSASSAATGFLAAAGLATLVLCVLSVSGPRSWREPRRPAAARA